MPIEEEFPLCAVFIGHHSPIKVIPVVTILHRNDFCYGKQIKYVKFLAFIIFIPMRLIKRSLAIKFETLMNEVANEEEFDGQ